MIVILVAKDVWGCVSETLVGLRKTYNNCTKKKSKKEPEKEESKLKAKIDEPKPLDSNHEISPEEGRPDMRVEEEKNKKENLAEEPPLPQFNFIRNQQASSVLESPQNDRMKLRRNVSSPKPHPKKRRGQSNLKHKGRKGRRRKSNLGLAKKRRKAFIQYKKQKSQKKMSSNQNSQSEKNQRVVQQKEQSSSEKQD